MKHKKYKTLRKQTRKPARKQVGLNITLFIFIVAIMLSVMSFNLALTGYFTVGHPAGGVEWENKISVTANSSQQDIIQHIVFGSNRPEICADGVRVETSDGQQVVFKTANEAYGEQGLCTETDVVFGNLIYQPPQAEQPPSRNFSLTGAGTAQQQTITYDIYYGKIVAQPQQAPVENLTIPKTGIINETNVTKNPPKFGTLANNPTQGTPLLNATSNYNTTADNITCYNQSSVNVTTNIYNWYVNNKTFASVYYPFDSDDSGGVNTTKDYSGNTLNGELGNATNNDAAEPTWTSSGKVGGAYSFDGGDCVIILNSSATTPIATPTNITVEGWFKTTQTTQAFIFSIEGGYAVEINFGGATNGAMIALFAGTSTGRIQQGSGYNDGNWHYFVAENDGTQTRLYMDGSTTPLYTFNEALYDIDTLNRPVDIGSQANTTVVTACGGTFFNGTIDEFAVYSNYTFTPAQIAKRYLDMNASFTNNRTIVSGMTSVGDNWTCRITPSNTTIDGTAANSSNLTILSGAPTQSNPKLNSTTGQNATDDNLTCYNQTTYSPAGRSVTNIYNWYKNGTSLMLLNMPFDSDDSGGINTTKDYSGNGNNGQLGASTDKDAAEPTWTSAGKIGGAYIFNGSQYITTTDISYFNGANTLLTTSAWVNIKNVSAAQNVISKYSQSTSPMHRTFLVQINLGYVRIVAYQDGDTNNYVYYQTGAILSNNVWTHIVGVWNLTAQTIDIYINGTKVATTNTTQGTPPTVFGDTTIPVDIGRAEGASYVNGTIDDVRLYGRALSAAEINQLYLDTVNGYSSNQTYVSAELSLNDVWMCQVTPNDALFDGTTANSSNLTIVLATNISACRTLTVANTTYNLTSNLSGNQSNGRCIDVQASNVTLDCGGWNVTGTYSGTTYGIYVGAYNNTAIKNCIITNYTNGIYLTSSNLSNIINNTASNTTSYGIYLIGSSNNTLTNNTANSGNGYGICLTSSNNNTIINNTANYNNNGISIFINNSATNNITNNTVNSNSYGIYIYYSVNNTVSQNTLYYDANNPIYLKASNNTNVTLNIESNSSINGILLETTSNYNNLINNTFTNNPQYGVYLSSSNNNTLTNNTVINSGQGDIVLGSSSNNSFTNNVVTNSTSWSFNSVGSSSNKITNLTTNDTTSSFTYSGDFSLKSANGTGKTDPLGYTNISHYLNITNGTSGAWIYINMSYKDSDVPAAISNTSTLQILKYSSSQWWGPTVVGTPNGVDTTNKYVYANITNFSSIYAPMGITNGGNVSSCQSILAYGTYNLTSNLQGISDSSCLNITASNVTLDCKGYSISANASGQGYGIYGSGVSNITIKNCNTKDYNLSQIYLNNAGGANLIQNNTLYNASYAPLRGIWLAGTTANTTVTNNTVYSSSLYDIQLDASGTGNVVQNTIIGSAYPTNANLTYGGSVGIKGVTSPNADPTGFRNISKYVNVTNLSANTWAFLNISYTDANAAGLINKTTLRMSKYNATAPNWYTDPTTFASSSGNDSTNNYVYANITNFGSLFAPMGQVVVNISACQTLSTANIIYGLNQSIAGQDGANSWCLRASANGITIDCQGYNVSANASGMSQLYGIYTSSTNITVKNCNVRDFATAQIAFVGVTGVNNTIQNNTAYQFNNFSGNQVTQYEIYLSGTTANTTVINNTVRNASTADLFLGASGTGNVVQNTLIDGPYPTKINLTWGPSATANINVKAATSPPSDPATFTDIGKYVIITNSSNAWAFLNISYTDADAATVNKSTLRMSKNNGSWYTDPTQFAGSSGNDSTNDYVYANITSLGSTFAPMGTSNGNISSCQILSIANTIYNLTTNLSGNQSTGRCIDIQANNVTLDCAGYSINGTTAGTTYGIYAGAYNNTTIKNCVVINYTNGIYLASSNISNIINNTVRNSTNSGYGIYLTSSNNNTLTNNTANNNTNYGIWLAARSNSNNLTNNIVNNNIYYGITLDNSNNNTLTNNTATSNGWYGIFVYTALSNNLINNTANSNTQYGIYLMNTSNSNNLTNNTASYNTIWDFNSADSSNNKVINFTTNDTTSSFTYSGDFGLKSANGTGRTDPAKYTNISHYLNITNSTSAWVYINMSYKDADVPAAIWNTSAIQIWKYSSSQWWNSTYVGTPDTVDTVNKYVYANITNFSSIYAPLGSIAGGNVSGCRALGGGGTYNLTANLSGISDSSCLNITVGDVVLDCKGYSISSNTTGQNYGIYDSGVANVTIKNCNIKDYNQSQIYLNNVGGTNIIQNCTLSNSTNTIQNGIWLAGTTAGTTITNNTVYGATQYDIQLAASSGTGNKITSTIIGNVNATSINLTYTGSVGIKAASFPAPTGDYRSIGRTVDVTNLSANTWALLNVSYLSSDVPADVVESNLQMAKNNGSWYTDPSTFASSYSVDTGNHFVWANITNFGSKFGPLGFSQNVSACRTINAAGTYNITGNLSGATQLCGGQPCCINIATAGVVLDCKGFSIAASAGGQTYGVYSNSPSTTVQNCDIADYDQAQIYFTGAMTSTIQNDIVHNSSQTIQRGIWLTGTGATTITGSTAYNAAQYDIELDSYLPGMPNAVRNTVIGKTYPTNINFDYGPAGTAQIGISDVTAPTPDNAGGSLRNISTYVDIVNINAAAGTWGLLNISYTDGVAWGTDKYSASFNIYKSSGGGPWQDPAYWTSSWGSDPVNNYVWVNMTNFSSPDGVMGGPGGSINGKCAWVNMSGYWYLTNPIPQDVHYPDVCISITSSDVIFDSKNYQIASGMDFGTSRPYGVVAGKYPNGTLFGSALTNITVNNTLFSSFTTEAIEFDNITNGSITNNTMYNSNNMPDWDAAGIHLSGSNRINVTNNTLNLNTSIVVCNSSNSLLKYNNLSNSSGAMNWYSIYVGGGTCASPSSYNNTIDSNKITNCVSYGGIEISAYYGGTFLNNTISNNNLTYCNLAIWGANGTRIINNTITKVPQGFSVTGPITNYLNLTNNTFYNNLYDIYVPATNANNITLVNNTIGTQYPTKIANLVFGGGTSLSVSGLNTTQWGPVPDPFGFRNISKYVYLYDPSGNTSTWAYLNISYLDSDVTTVNESTLAMAGYSNPNWNTNASNFTSTYGVDTANNIVYANITSLARLFAPLAPSCTNISQSNTNYTLTADIVGNSTGGICIQVLASNITLDCAGHSITGNTSIGIGNTPEYGIYLQNSYSNNIIKNCIISNYSQDIYIQTNSNNNTIVNTTAKNTHIGVIEGGSAGIHIKTSSSNNTVVNSTIYTSPYQQYGIQIDTNSLYNNITNNTIYNTTYGINASTNSNNLVNNTLFNNSWVGIWVVGSNNNITNNTAYNNSAYGISVNGSSNVISKNTAYTNNQGAITLYGNSNNITNNTCYNNNGTAIFFGPPAGGFTGNIISGNVLSNNTAGGIYLSGSTSSQVGNNIVYNSSDGIYITQLSSNNAVANNTVYGGTGSGIRIDTNSTTVTNNTCYSNSQAGISVDGSNWVVKSNNITNNTFYNNTQYGISITGAGASQNNFTNINSTSNSLWDFYSPSSSPNNTIINLTTNDTTSSFTYYGNFSLKPSNGTGRTDPTGYANISHYLNITQVTAGGSQWMFLNMSYKNSDVPSSIADQSTLKIWKYSSSQWWNSTYVGSPDSVDTTNKYVYANITNFSSIYAPLGYMGIVNCANLTIANSQYNLTGNLSGVQSGRSMCIDAQVDNVTLDCKGYSINGTTAGTTYGVYASARNNVTIKNCTVQNYSSGIYIVNTGNSVVVNNTANNNTQYGIQDYISNGYNIITNNTAYSNAKYGIFVSSGYCDNLTGNTLNNNTQYGTYIDSSINITLINNTANSNSQAGIGQDHTDYGIFTNNTANSNANYGIIIARGNNNNLTNNTANNNGQYGIYCWISHNNTITNNTANNNTQYGIYLSPSSNDTLTNNNASLNSIWDFASEGSSNNTVTNLTTNDTTSSFTYSGDIYIKSANGTGKTDPAKYTNISHYLNITNGTSAWVYINMSYKTSDVPAAIWNTSTLQIWKYSSSQWWNSTYVGTPDSVDTTNKFVYANITNFSSIYAPLGGTNHAPNAPTLFSPADGSTNNFNRTPYLNWTIPTDADGDTLHFQLQLANDSGFSQLVINQSSVTNITGFNPTPPVAQGVGNESYAVQSNLWVDKQYFWRVRAYDGYDWGSWSTTFSFNISPLVQCPFGINITSFGSGVTPGTAVNGTSNYAGPSSGTLYNVSNTGNVNENMTQSGTNMSCISAGCPGDYIDVSNISWKSSTTSANDTSMIYANGIKMTAAYDTANPVASYLPPTNVAWYRQWLTSRSKQGGGTYNGTYTQNCIQA